jgi:hypothetical protein
MSFLRGGTNLTDCKPKPKNGASGEQWVRRDLWQLRVGRRVGKVTALFWRKLLIGWAPKATEKYIQWLETNSLGKTWVWGAGQGRWSGASSQEIQERESSTRRFWWVGEPGMKWKRINFRIQRKFLEPRQFPNWWGIWILWWVRTSLVIR